MNCRRCALLFALGALLGCQPETVVVARSDVDPTDLDCRSNADCALDELCAKPTCDAELGRCERRPTVCESAGAPVCGCDGVSYFNGCLRRLYGIVAETQGECGSSARTCAPTATCPEDAYCGMLFHGSNAACESLDHGVCWVMPTTCGVMVPGDRFDACAEEDECADACRAIKSERPYRRVQSCGL